MEKIHTMTHVSIYVLKTFLYHFNHFQIMD